MLATLVPTENALSGGKTSFPMGQLSGVGSYPPLDATTSWLIPCQFCLCLPSHPHLMVEVPRLQMQTTTSVSRDGIQAYIADAFTYLARIILSIGVTGSSWPQISSDPQHIHKHTNTLISFFLFLYPFSPRILLYSLSWPGT